jgi:hypothetical protein
MFSGPQVHSINEPKTSWVEEVFKFFSKCLCKFMKIIRGSKNVLLKCYFWGGKNFFKNGILGGAIYKNIEWRIAYLKLKGCKKSLAVRTLAMPVI